MCLKKKKNKKNKNTRLVMFQLRKKKVKTNYEVQRPLG